jgi:hypothetical protein
MKPHVVRALLFGAQLPVLIIAREGMIGNRCGCLQRQQALFIGLEILRKSY